MTCKPTDYWATPKPLFERLNAVFNFTIDACANADNAKLPRYFDEEADGLEQSWAGERVFCNPPYSKTAQWLQKALIETRDLNCPLAVLLINVSTGSRYWHDFIINPRAEVVFLKGRVKFEPPPGIKASTPRHDSALIIYRGQL